MLNETARGSYLELVLMNKNRSHAKFCCCCSVRSRANHPTRDGAVCFHCACRMQWNAVDASRGM
jgi:hypothetical protein